MDNEPDLTNDQIRGALQTLAKAYSELRKALNDAEENINNLWDEVFGDD